MQKQQSAIYEVQCKYKSQMMDKTKICNSPTTISCDIDMFGSHVWSSIPIFVIKSYKNSQRQIESKLSEYRYFVQPKQRS